MSLLEVIVAVAVVLVMAMVVAETLGNAITFDFVDQVQVKTAGFEAEYGQSTGGIVNVQSCHTTASILVNEFEPELLLDLGDLTERGMGVRMNRFSMLVDDGVVTQLNVEGPGKFEVSDAETLLGQMG